MIAYIDIPMLVIFLFLVGSVVYSIIQDRNASRLEDRIEQLEMDMTLIFGEEDEEDEDLIEDEDDEEADILLVDETVDESEGGDT